MTWTDLRVLDKTNDIEVDNNNNNGDDDGDVDGGMLNC